MPTLPSVDSMLLTALGISMLLGFWRGVVTEVLSLLGWGVGFFMAQRFAPDAAAWLPLSDSSQMLRYGAGFGSVFAAVLVATNFLSWIVRNLLSAVGLGMFDRLLGSLFGLLRGVLVLSVITLLVNLTPMRETPIWRQAQGVQWLQQFLHVLKPMLSADFGKYLP